MFGPMIAWGAALLVPIGIIVLVYAVAVTLGQFTLHLMAYIAAGAAVLGALYCLVHYVVALRKSGVLGRRALCADGAGPVDLDDAAIVVPRMRQYAKRRRLYGQAFRDPFIVVRAMWKRAVGTILRFLKATRTTLMSECESLTEMFFMLLLVGIKWSFVWAIALGVFLMAVVLSIVTPIVWCAIAAVLLLLSHSVALAYRGWEWVTARVDYDSAEGHACRAPENGVAFADRHDKSRECRGRWSRRSRSRIVYYCPGCGYAHSHLRAGAYGFRKRICALCGTKFSTTARARSVLTADCMMCGREFNPENYAGMEEPTLPDALLPQIA